MNKICEKCDTKCRLGLCRGKEEDFKYCFRRVGSLSGLEETITPFSTLHELYNKQPCLKWIVPETLVLDNKPYAKDNNMVLLFGQTKKQIGTNVWQPVGYVTVLDASKMERLEYSRE